MGGVLRQRIATKAREDADVTSEENSEKTERLAVRLKGTTGHYLSKLAVIGGPDACLTTKPDQVALYGSVEVAEMGWKSFSSMEDGEVVLFDEAQEDEEEADERELVSGDPAFGSPLSEDFERMTT